MADLPEINIDAPAQENASLSPGPVIGRSRIPAVDKPGFSSHRTLWRPLVAVVSLFLVAVLAAYTLLPWPRPSIPAEGSPQYHWQQAMLALEQDDPVLAKTHLSRCLEFWPLNAEVYFLLARTCRRTDDRPGWQLHLHKAQILEWPKEDLEFEHRLMQAQSGELQTVEQRLLADLSKASPLEQLNIFEALAKGYLKIDRLTDVLALTREWIERYPNQWQPRFFRGRVFQLGHSPDRAIAEFRRLLELNPDHVYAHFELAGALLLNSELPEALEHFQLFLRHYPDDPAALAGLANCQFSLGEFAAAQATLNQLFAKHPEHAAGFFLQAKLELALNKPQEALRWLRRGEALAPYEMDILYNLVLVYQRLGKDEEAKRAEQKLHEARRRFDRLDAIKKQILTESGSASRRHEAGAIALSLGRDEEALHWLHSALHLDPNHRATHQLLADYYAKRGDGMRAANHRRKAQEK